MKTSFRAYIWVLSVLAALPLQIQLHAQNTNWKRPHYIVRDMGTFGGPSSFFASQPIVQSVNNRGVVVGGADTDLPDPYGPNCVSPDCHISHAFKWKNGDLLDLGTLPGGYSSIAYWVNEQDRVIGDSENGLIDPFTGSPEQVAVLWDRDGEIVDLGTLGGNFSFPNAMNNSGQVVGIALNGVPDSYSFLGAGTETRAFIWQDGFMRDLGTLGGPDSWADTINGRGEVVGWAYTNSMANANNGDQCAPNVPTQDPLVWKDGRMIDLGGLGGTCGVVGAFSGGGGGAINSRGQIAGTSNLAGNQTYHAFLWNDGALTDLGTLGGNNSEAYWINDAGDIVGHADIADSHSHHAFLWKDGKVQDLGVPAGQTCSTALQINSKGQIIIDTAICGVSSGPGCLWENGTLYDLNALIPPDSGFYIRDVNYINDRGEIAVTGVLPNGDQHALLLIPFERDDDQEAGELPVAPSVPPQIRQSSRSLVSSGRQNPIRGRFANTKPALP